MWIVSGFAGTIREIAGGVIVVISEWHSFIFWCGVSVLLAMTLRGLLGIDVPSWALNVLWALGGAATVIGGGTFLLGEGIAAVSDRGQAR